MAAVVETTALCRSQELGVKLTQLAPWLTAGTFVPSVGPAPVKSVVYLYFLVTRVVTYPASGK